jgi:hypothetical protein
MAHALARRADPGTLERMHEGRAPMRPLAAALMLLCPLIVEAGEAAAPAKPVPQAAEMAGYLLVPVDKVAETWNAGFSLYVAAWPLLAHYPGHRFQSGLFGTWMHPQYDGPAPANLYTDVEGGLGWWRDTRFPTETPKFIMGGVGANFRDIANGPAHGAGSWEMPRGLYGVAQLSPWLLFPIDGLNLAQGTCGELFGYGYLTLPLLTAKAATNGTALPTGDRCWTLFLNTRTFKGPVAFFTPYFWSHASEADATLAGKLLDSRPAGPNRPLQMETQYIPAFQATDATGETYARIAPVLFPSGPDGSAALIHRITAYSTAALWDATKAWLDGGPPASGAIDPAGAVVHALHAQGGATWRISLAGTAKEQRWALAWNSVATPMAVDASTYGYRWSMPAVAPSPDGRALVRLPEYWHLLHAGAAKPQWVAVPAQDVPPETGLAGVRFERPGEKPPEPYLTPDAATSCWRRPGPVAGPFQAHLGDGSVVTYSWYRFADQPALLHADLSDAERELLQSRVVKLHRAWTKERDYLAPPTCGTLAALDAALLVTPPAGLEAGYVPIATRQEGARTP